MQQTVPHDILTNERMALDEALSESEYLALLKQIAARNIPFRSMIGMGWYGTSTPSVLL